MPDNTKNTKLLYKSNNTMNIKEFVNQLEEYSKVACWRNINVTIHNNKKIPLDEKNNMTPDDILINRGCSDSNTYSIYIKHIPNLYVVDFDQKDLDKCDLYCKLKKENVAHTETAKGYHFYMFINDIPPYSNQY